MEQLTVVGISETGCQSLASRAFNAIASADVLVGAQRFLDFFADFPGERIRMGEGGLKVGAAIEKIRSLLPQKKIVVLASGDPMLFGIGALLCREFADDVEVLPHPSSVQWAAARLGWRLEDLEVWSYHGRPVHDFIRKLRQVDQVAILTDGESAAPRLAQLLIENNEQGWQAWVGESLGGVDEKVRCFSLTELAQAKDIDPLHILLLKRGEEDPKKPILPYLPEEAFAKKVPKLGLITKREVRVLSLAALGLKSGGVLWDLGAGSGSVGIEAALMVEGLKVYAVECDPECVAMCEFNAKQMGLDLSGSYRVIEGLALDKLAELPDPDHVFIGGSKGKISEMISEIFARLRPNGRLVVNAITLDNVSETYQTFSRLQIPFELSVVNISRGMPLAGKYLRYEALNPVHIFWTTKPGQTSPLQSAESFRKEHG